MDSNPLRPRHAARTLAHLSVVFFALVNVIGLLAYAFKGIGKFAGPVMLPWHFTGRATGIFTRRQHLRA